MGPMSHAATIHRIEVSPKPGHADPVGAAVQRDAKAIGIPVAAVRASHVYLVSAALSPEQVRSVAGKLLADPVTESAFIGSSAAAAGARTVEVHPLPGVMDPVAQSVQGAIRELAGVEARVWTGSRTSRPIRSHRGCWRIL